ncbi:hypothetical protein L1987_65322 [Smallanthus sonchifolius]|uniref:Uncharacterized protein n=1 Tax=Smallanthus sonchifolius TaxID=185202 RepID=A0ACB9BU75_9ASTR|nr:hypothetical protein L1987_65322 [Smallanthus sonchifolius]
MTTVSSSQPLKCIDLHQTVRRNCHVGGLGNNQLICRVETYDTSRQEVRFAGLHVFTTAVGLPKTPLQQFLMWWDDYAKLEVHKTQQLDCLTAFPDVSGAPNMERLILSGCTNLVEVHESLGSHKRLVKLDMVGCERLKYLPSRIEMESLKVLRLTKCSSLERFPDVSTRMVNLSCINLDYCFSIEELPNSVGYLSSLDYLNLMLDSEATIPDHRNNRV